MSPLTYVAGKLFGHIGEEVVMGSFAVVLVTVLVLTPFAIWRAGEAFVGGVGNGYVNACKAELLAEGMTPEDADVELKRRMKSAKAALPFTSFGLMVGLTILTIVIPLSWPPLAICWMRYFRQLKLYRKQELSMMQTEIRVR